MSCPTCDHTMHGIGYGMFHCPRCGTLTNCPADGAVSVPALVGRCRAFEKSVYGDPLPTLAGNTGRWHQLGIAESINLPGARP